MGHMAITITVKLIQLNLKVFFTFSFRLELSPTMYCLLFCFSPFDQTQVQRLLLHLEPGGAHVPRHVSAAPLGHQQPSPQVPAPAPRHHPAGQLEVLQFSQSHEDFDQLRGNSSGPSD